MAISKSASRITTAFDDRAEELRQKLGYPVKERDPQGSDFYYLRAGSDAVEAADTCPIAVGFYSDEATDERSLKSLLTSPEWQQRIYGHYTNRTAEQQPVMYILLPTEGSGQVPLVLPMEGGLRQRNIQAFAWGSVELETRLNRLRQDELPVASGVLASVPLVERAFYKPIQTAKELAQLLATAARRIEQVLPDVYQDEKRRYATSQGEEGYLHKLLKSFQQELLPSLQLVSKNEKDYSFSDIYAQTIAYSLFTARVFGYVRDREAGQKEALFDRQSAWQQLPETNPFLRKLFQDVSERFAEELGDELIGAIADIFAILRAAKMDVILQDFRQKQNREDIVIRFYEDFLAAYKPEVRERRGVYYTPEPVVSYMVRSVDVLLKEKFDKPLGLADPEVMILDPACGTGTFLLWICQLIHDCFHTEREAMIARVGDISWSEYVSEHLLPRIFGFELLMAPYAIAHLKLGLFLEETGYKFSSNKRLSIYLTNALEQSAPGKSEIIFQEFIANEGREALEVKKDKDVMVVIGNPPYSRDSHNRGEWIESLMKDYKVNVGKEESQIQGLSNDYIKFIRFAQSKIDRTLQGILAFITGHGYIKGSQARDMRASLLQSFNEIDVIELNGSIRRQSLKSANSHDEPVFNIQQGTAITLACKTSSSINSNRHFELYGSLSSKLGYLDANTVKTTAWQNIEPETPYFLLEPNFQTSNAHALAALRREYNALTCLTRIYGTGNREVDKEKFWATGFATQQDELAVSFSAEEVKKKVSDLLNSTCEQELRKIYKVCTTNQWSYNRAKRELVDTDLESKIAECSFRPFDTRLTVFDKNIVTVLRENVMRHLSQEPALALVISRAVNDSKFAHVFATDSPTDKIFLSSKSSTNAYIFPLYLHPETQAEKQMGMVCRPNFSQPFLNDIADRLGYTPTPEAIFYYIYAIFHSPTYRSRYAEFLKIDFPRVPLTRNDALFRQLAIYGEQLVALHLMKSPKLDQLITEFVDQGGNAIVAPAHPKYNNGSVIINKKGDRFVNVPEAVWNFYVGGYQVCAKWLKDRKGRTLTPEDILHYQRIVVALQETILLMQQIDEVIPEFPIV